MKKITKKSLILMCLFFTLVLTVGVTYAWLSALKTKEINPTPGKVNQTDIVLFLDTEANRNENKVYEIDATKDNDNENSIKKLSVVLNLTPEIDCYFRVKLEDEWVITTRYKSTGNESVKVVGHETLELVPFNIVGDNWYYRESDGYYYYKELLKKNQNYEITFVSGGNYYETRENTIIEETCLVNLNFILDSVQSNRYLEIWGTDEFLERTGE